MNTTAMMFTNSNGSLEHANSNWTGGVNSTAVPRPGSSARDIQAVWHISLGYILPVILIFGMVGNSMNLLVFTSSKHFKAVTYIYLRWIAVADMLAMVLLWIFVVLQHGVRLTTLAGATYFAHVQVPLTNAFLVTSALLVLAISVERYISVCHPHDANNIVTAPRAKALVAATYLGTMLVFTPQALASTVTQLGNSSLYMALPNQQVTHTTWFNAYTWTHVILFKFVPFFLIITLNLITFVRFRKTVLRRSQYGRASAASASHHRQETRLMVLLLCTASLYVACLTPMAVMFVMKENGGDKWERFLNNHIFMATANLLEYTNSAANFYIYCLASSDFRTHLRIVVRRTCCCGFIDGLFGGDGCERLSPEPNSVMSPSHHHPNGHTRPETVPLTGNGEPPPVLNGGQPY